MLQEIKLNAREIDEYIAEFEDLARQANYTLGNAETIRLFVQGLTPSMMRDVMRSPTIHGYDAIVQRAIKSAQAQCTLDNLLKGCNDRPRVPQSTGYFNNSNQNRNPRQGLFPTYRQNQYNSTNAPRWMNDQVVPMDLSRTRAPTW